MNVGTIPFSLWTLTLCSNGVSCIMDHDQTLPGTVVYLQKDNEDHWSCCYAKI